MSANNLQNFSLVYYASFCVGAVASICFSILWALDVAGGWIGCYATAIFLSLLFLRTHRHNLLSLSGIFVGLSLISITLPAAPYLLFEFEPTNGFYASIFLNSLGQIYFVTLALLLAPSRALYCPDSQLFQGTRWMQFVQANRLVCLTTFPLVLLAITQSGGWGYLFGDRSGEFDRIASLKGFGPLMIFSVINVMALFFWVSGVWLQGRKWIAFAFAAFFLFFNGFTGGRQNIISFFIGGLIIHIALSGFSKKTLLLIPLVGLSIVFMKAFRVSGVDNVLDMPWYVNFFLQFAGDFDSLNNDSSLVEYTRENGFFGFYHIWSSILIYLPRDIFPWKPHDLGGLYLNTYLFPGVYLGAEGGTGLAIGFQGIWFAAYGLITLLLGNFLLAISLGWADRHVYRRLHYSAPGLFLVAYIFLAGQSVIIYREGFYAFLNTGLYASIYFIFFKFSQSLVRKNEPISSPRHLESARREKLASGT